MFFATKYFFPTTMGFFNKAHWCTNELWLEKLLKPSDRISLKTSALGYICV